jgi:hypothetical protein
VSDETRTTVGILRAARHRIESPRRWCQGSFAVRGSLIVKPASKRATRWCAVGAVHAELGTDPYTWPNVPSPVLAALWDAAKALYSEGTWMVNDFRGHDAILRVFDEAIRRAEEAPGPAGVAGG